MKTQPSILCLVDNHCGIYIPQTYAERYRSFTSGISDETWKDLLAGPDSDTSYWDAWDEVLSDGIFADDKGYRYRLTLGECGDVLAVPESWQWSDWAQAFVPPESDTLKRFILPSIWEDDGWLANDLPGPDMAQIESFLAKAEMQTGVWHLADVSPSQATKWNDAQPGMIQDCSEFTFIRIP